MTSVAMTIAGSDSGGGAGIQADLKTFQELGAFGTSAITAVTSQNTLGVHDVYAVAVNNVISQIKAVLDDFQVGAIKTGMLFSAEIIHGVAETLKSYDLPMLIIDPVMIAKGGASLLLNEAVHSMKTELLPLATIITPNIPEAEVLTGLTIHSDSDVENAANRLITMGAKAVVLKGGHRDTKDYAEDLFLSAKGERFIMRSERIDTKDTHGTGCTFSAAIAARLAQGFTASDAVIDAKYFIQAAIKNGLQLGAGHGPTNHWAYREISEKARKEVMIIE
ncbi:bifunctional hydroxymethylpyrimidine kinase/phosphomethylpyrimidine kinase [Viridibacillus sp. FSL R5-0477]|uniref:Hydroxymethylpyrimidine/phosphomethylpyrimidine kinase n=1 Tax=Viridibacillus arenosi FSL R5-213 TaxID=1227360 RepID=W4ERV3_9BACL|nr:MULTISPECIES: bifunctional hydroxymethylpyrimidine kinase/phosphomethylpyrimidine kinase [Viridibacillus]ETT82989.1 phosphomethylpyrimidine kinase [Viridibacillus arenosi FSL R5-213]OMC82070.1 hydroxymethylpyrimidine/phosphomethylpyrimidine kinase [Viridibacillus sp. FSL H8-0123]OMC86228.1 hydroxymethylpyrimidine/phosphomethylpyrimidine kinase [Viridibacillus sp. FSL H7-0596]OMC90869.1 hydroxymethylpyrimidine/phosphomethylpyrimidine kinase [Viridibacillus arenosi]